MKPAPFERRAAHSVDEAVSFLAEVGDEGKVLAGGQSLVAMMNLRLAAPRWLVDISRVDELAAIRDGEGHLEIGAALRQSQAEDAAEVGTASPLLAAALPLIAHREIRNAGTVCGSAAHADPAAEIPAVALAEGAEFVARSARGERVVPASEFFVGYLSTALEADELLVAMRVPRAPSRTGAAFQELSPRAGDYGIVGVAVSLTTGVDGRVERASIAYSGVDATPVAGTAGQDVIAGNPPDAELFADAARAAAADLDPTSDLNGSSEYRRHVAEVLTRRALDRAAAVLVEG